MKIVVTGGAGFIGSNVVEAYVDQGHEVVVIDNLSSGIAKHVHPGAKLHKLDVRSKDAVELITSFKPDVLNLHAAQIDVRKSVTDPVNDLDINVGAALNLLEAARRAGVKRVVYAASGGSMYGDTQVMPTPENQPVRPVSPYGVSKATLELYLQAYQAMYGLHYVALRYANVYGPRQNAHGEAGVVSIFIERMLKGERATIYGDGLQTRDFVHVYDVVSANVKALTCSFTGGVNIATGQQTSVARVYDLVARALNEERPALIGDERAGEQKHSVLSNALARQVLEWAPEWVIEKGIMQTVEWFKWRRGRTASSPNLPSTKPNLH